MKEKKKRKIDEIEREVLHTCPSAGSYCLSEANNWFFLKDSLILNGLQLFGPKQHQHT
jgi:hypothetical protein